jgi:hypothetical protein
MKKWHHVILPSRPLQPQDTLHSQDFGHSRDVSSGSLTKLQVLYADFPTIHPMIRLSEISYLLCLQGFEPSISMCRQLRTPLYGGENASQVPTPIQRLRTGRQEALPTWSLSGR